MKIVEKAMHEEVTQKEGMTRFTFFSNGTTCKIATGKEDFLHCQILLLKTCLKNKEKHENCLDAS